jgi:glutamate N-acetyltransferase / amino-acid N-acetyltransferase
VSVTYPRGFRAAGVTAGLKASGRPDLGLLVADDGAAAAGAFTTNAFPAAPVILSRSHLASGRTAAVVVNSGQANAGTGPEGLDDAKTMARLTGSALGCDATEVLVCSTGVIGPRVPLDRIGSELPTAAGLLDPTGGTAFAESILTTDRAPKEATADTGPYRVGGCAKGAGMIAPRLAPLGTLLAFITTDAPATAPALQRIVAERIVPAWNGLVVDGCQSTNDTVLLLATGAAGGTAIGPEDPGVEDLAEAIGDVSVSLARRTAAEAEGASTTLVVQVEGAGTADEARGVGLAVAGSPLVKTALFGADPNAGRILQAVGDAGVELDPAAFDVRLDNVPLISSGRVLEPNDTVAAAMKEPEVVLTVSVGNGSGSATVFGCDLGYEYVRINAEYRT